MSRAASRIDVDHGASRAGAGDVARAAVVAIAAYPLLGGAVSLAGWAFDVPALADWIGSGISIQPNTTIAAMAASVGIALLAFDRRLAALAFGALVALIGASALVQYLGGFRFEMLNTALMFDREWGRGSVVKPGLMGPAGATCWLLLGTALVSAAKGSRRLAAALALVPLAVTLLAAAGYLYGADRLYTLPTLTVIALQTATFIAAAAIALLAAIPEHPPLRWLTLPGAAGRVARVATPLVLLLPPLLGWLRLAGERLGLYETRFGIAVFSVVMVALLFALVAWCTRTIARHEHALRVSEGRLMSILESITDGFVTFDRDWRFTFVNAEAERMLGRSARSLVGRVAWEVFPESIGTTAHEELLRAARTRTTVEFLGYATAHERWYVNKAYPTADGGVSCYFEDVTDRRRLESITDEQNRLLELAASGRPLDDCFRELAASVARVQPKARAGVCTVDPSTGAVDAASGGPASFSHVPVPAGGACELAIRSGNPVVSSNIGLDDRFSTAWRQWCGARGTVATLSVPVRASDDAMLGAFFLAFAEPHVLSDWEYKLAQFGADFARVVLTRELTARRLDAELDAMTRLQTLSTRLVQGADVQALLQEILAAAAELSGTFKGNIQRFDPATGTLRIIAHQGLGPAFLAYFGDDCHAGSCGDAARAVQRTIVDDVLHWPGFAGTRDLEILLADGVRACQSTPLVARDGRLIGMINTHFVSPRRPAPEQLRHLDLLARMAADFLERIAHEEALREADRRKTHFLAVLAHELRNPLAPIRTGAFLLKQQPDDAAGVLEVAAMIQRQVEQLVRLVDDLLDVSRISLDRIELRLDRVELQAVLRDAAEAIAPEVRKNGHRLALELPVEPIVLRADRARLAQIVGNLLHNACRFTRDGGRIEVFAERRGGDALIRVRDNGLGIAAEHLPRIFELFTQVDGSRARAAGGLGVGLTLVRKLVELHGGTVEARSEGLGRGSEFVVRLPLLAAARGGDLRESSAAGAL